MEMSPQPPGRNEPCWCGSGRKFKKCHLDRGAARALPFEAIRNQAALGWEEKRCLHPLASPDACDRIIAAHTVQRSTVLKRLVDTSKHLKTFYREFSPNPRKVGWRDASTFPGFCGRHDDQTFSALEKSPFEGTSEQCFLVGYRALCHEIHQKRASIRTSRLIRELGDRGYPEDVQRTLQRNYQLIEAGARKGLAAFEELKRTMDQSLLSGDFSGWSRLVIRFSGPLSVASTGAVSPNRDLDGEELQMLHDTDPEKQETLLYGVVTTAATEAAVVLVWREGQRAPERFVDSLMRRGSASLPGLLVQFMFAYVENTFFSAQWWESLTSDRRHHLERLAHLSNAYYTPFSYIPGPLVPWCVIDGALNGAMVGAAASPPDL